ncbi:hypothetical protein M514_15938 [Trichuris suis]|uniref:Uncharacterized protein n=1 Tax=Trichuris suis TaxID=68888 RepID=A0A085NQT2_9BILA|nr:hypothetical protein M514_15938 [Trichuris suis]
MVQPELNQTRLRVATTISHTTDWISAVTSQLFINHYSARRFILSAEYLPDLLHLREELARCHLLSCVLME